MHESALQRKSIHTTPRPNRPSTGALPHRTGNTHARFCKRVALFLVGMTVLAIALFAPSVARAQKCSGNVYTGCTSPGTSCSPVEVGTGQTGHCQTPNGLPRGERICSCIGAPVPPTPISDVGCHDRSARGKFTCLISQPKVTQHETAYPNVVFAPGDVVEVTANGCVQTGGIGSTWKRYVNPSGPKSNEYYHGLVRIPTAVETQGALVRMNKIVGERLHVTGLGVPVSQLYLHLGYEDDDYSDNGYYSHDDGTDGQCKITDADPVSGGPAYVVVTIYRGVSPGVPQSNYDFDVLSDAVDPNGLPYNPWWSWQLRPEHKGKEPNTSICHDFSTRESTLGIPNMFMSPYFADCTDQADLSTVDLPSPDSLCWWGTGPYVGSTFAGHVNWFPITVEGTAHAVKHSGAPYPFGDDDYTFGFSSQNKGNPLSVNPPREGLHVEFDSDETIDHFQDPSPYNEWKALRDAVDNNGNVAQLFRGHTILTGMFGLDAEHDLKAELHPLFAMATLRDDFENSANDEAWLMFVRNQGDEGYCSESIWYLGLEDYTFHLPWRSGATSVAVNWDKTFFAGTDGTSGPTVSAVRPTIPARQGDKNAGVYITFHLGPPAPHDAPWEASVPFIYGVLHLVWSGPQVHPAVGLGSARSRGIEPAVPPISHDMGGVRETTPAAETDEVEHALAESAKQLTPAQRQQIRRASAIAVTRAVPVHRLPPTGPVRELTKPPVVARIAKLHAIKGGPATRKLERDAAAMHALCAATNNAPPGLPAQVCRSNAPTHR
jgi:hypothetical protein